MKNDVKTGGKKQETGDILQIYFNQIRAYPVLETEEEIELARRIQKGDQKALHKLIQANLRLVVKVARLYATSDIPFMDLIQEGNMGLIHAAQKYDHAKKFRFCTYAGWWIRQFITRYLTNKHRMVKLPHRKEEILRRIQRSYHSLSQTLMHQPRNEDIADELGLSVQDIDYIVNMSTGPVSLEIGMDNNTTVMETHEDYTYSPERNLIQQYYRDEAQRFLGRLKGRERQVISYRYQFEDGKPHTLKEIGDKMDLSPETVRQIEKKAIIKIRYYVNELKKLGYMEAI